MTRGRSRGMSNGCVAKICRRQGRRGTLEEPLALQEERADALGERDQQLPLLAQERALVGIRPGLRVVDRELAHELFVDEDRCPLYPGGRCLAAVPVRVVPEAEHGAADPRVLPPVRDRGEHLRHDLVERCVEPADRFDHLVQAAKLLRALLERREQVVDASIGTHACLTEPRPCGRSRDRSGRSEEGWERAQIIKG